MSGDKIIAGLEQAVAGEITSTSGPPAPDREAGELAERLERAEFAGNDGTSAWVRITMADAEEAAERLRHTAQPAPAISEVREALRFYAPEGDAWRWEPEGDDDAGITGYEQEPSAALKADGGERAKAALALLNATSNTGEVESLRQQLEALRADLAKKEALRLCGYCEHWVSRPCGEGCRHDPTRDPTFSTIRSPEALGDQRDNSSVVPLASPSVTSPSAATLVATPSEGVE